MKKVLSLLFVFTLVACGGSDSETEVEESSFFEEGPTVEINDEQLSRQLSRLGLIEEGSNEVHQRKLDTIRHFEFQGSNPQIFNYLPNLSSLYFPNVPSSQSSQNKQFYIDAFKILNSTGRLSKLDSLVINYGTDGETFADPYYYDYETDTSGEFWRSLPNLKKLVIVCDRIPWGIQTDYMPLLEHIELSDMPCTYVRNLFYELDYNIILNLNANIIRHISVPRCTGTPNIENFINLEYLRKGSGLSSGYNISRLSKLKYLVLPGTDCADCLVVSQEQLDNLASLNWPEAENNNRERQECISNCYTGPSGGWCRNGYRYLYQIGSCRTFCDVDPYAGGDGSCD